MSKMPCHISDDLPDPDAEAAAFPGHELGCWLNYETGDDVVCTCGGTEITELTSRRKHDGSTE